MNDKHVFHPSILPHIFYFPGYRCPIMHDVNTYNV